MKRINYVVTLLLCLLISQAFAQTPPAKFGKIDESELKMTAYDKDVEAEALVLFDVGKTYYAFDNSGLSNYYERHCRIKIFKNEGFSYANQSITLLSDVGRKEDLYSFKAYCYNLENGKIIKTKVEKENMFTEDVTKNRRHIKFTFPNVKVGSVIEFEYEIRSDYIMNINNWIFQSRIPTLWSEYTVSVPEYFSFKRNVVGFIPLSKHENTSENKSIPMSNAQYTNSTEIFRMTMVPAFKDEPYMDAAVNYISSVNYEVESLILPNQMIQNFTTSWAKINELLMKGENFGLQFNSANFMKEDLQTAIKGSKSIEDTLNAVVALVKAKVKWNNRNSIFTNDNLRKVYKTGTGNSAEINLMLVAAFKELKLDVVPVAFSIRKAGIIMPVRATVDALNNVVALVKTPDRDYLLDATSPFSMPNILPTEYLNGNGRIIDKSICDWYDMTPKHVSLESTTTEFNVNAQGVVTAKVSIISQGNKALDKREKLSAIDTKERIKLLAKDLDGATISNYKLSYAKDSLTNPVVESFEAELAAAPTSSANMIYLNPFMAFRFTVNPFKQEERLYPINFSYPSARRFSGVIDIPEGFKVETVPANTLIKSPDGSLEMRVVYTLTPENKLIVMSSLTIRKTIIPAGEYQIIKSFFNEIIAKQAENIVLKKG